jgi:DNA-binding transcriptional MocR family regulator
MKKLSEQFLEMSQHTAALENRAAATRAENRKEFEAHVSEVRTRVQSFQNAFAARLGEAEENLAAQWREIDEAFSAQIARVQRQMDEQKNALDLKRAKSQADDAEAYAEIAAEFARLAAAEAESAMVEAKEARARAISLEKQA